MNAGINADTRARAQTQSQAGVNGNVQGGANANVQGNSTAVDAARNAGNKAVDGTKRAGRAA
ncbi:MAG: hypothetical protein EOP93_13785, partial [Lysobacteraceae bacterium]